MNKTIRTSISFPETMNEKLTRVEARLASKNLPMSKSRILVYCLKRYLRATNVQISKRDQAAQYNCADEEFHIFGVRWSADDYNVFRARAHTVRISLSYLFFLAFMKYYPTLTDELIANEKAGLLHEMIARANYFFHYHTRGEIYYGMYETAIYDISAIPQLNPSS